MRMMFKLFQHLSGPRGQRAALVLLGLILALSLALGQAAAGLTAPGAAVPTTADALRAQVAAADWVTVRLDLRALGAAAGVGSTAAADDLEQMAQDVLFTLPAGSYDTVERAAGSASMTLRVDAAGLDALLGSPWAAAVTAGGNPEMQRLAVGYGHSLAIKPDGSLWAWGGNWSGALGDGTTTDRYTPVQVLTGVAAVAASAGRYHSLAIKTDGSLWAWGFNQDGEVGDGTTTNRSTPVQVLTGVAAVASGNNHSLALKTDGSLWAWGSNNYGQLGDGTTTRRLTPVQVLTGVAAVASGNNHSLALKTDGSLWAWGYNGAGTVGDGTTTDRSTPVQVLTGVAAVAVGAGHSLALKPDGSLWAWGYNGSGQLGDGTTTRRLTPVQVLTGVAAVSNGWNNTRALKTDGSLWAWGDYRLFTPVQVLTGVAAVVASEGHSLAIKTDGSLWAWGENDYGELGDGTTTYRSTPVQVLTGVAAVSVGVFHTLARKTDGSLWAWGWNWSGRLGDGTTTTNRLRPVPVVGFGGSSVTGADFTVTNVNLTPSAPLVGGTFSAVITVKNRGTQDGTPGTLRVWANQRATQDCNAPGDADIPLASLAAGAKQTVRIRLPAGTAGYKTLRAFIDNQCETMEHNETNNQDSKNYRVFTQPIADFRVTAIDLTPTRPTAGGTFSAAVTVKNRGTAPGDAGMLALWVDQPGVPACGTAGDAAVAVGSLAAGASRTLTLDGLPAGTAGAKSLRAFVDHTCVSAEAYDGNNQWVRPYTVVP